MATIDYMIASYGPYSASATGGNALARDFLAGIAAMYSTPSELIHALLSRYWAYILWQCIRIWDTHIPSSGPPPSWHLCPLSSSFRYIYSIGRARRFGNGLHLRRPWPLTGRKLDARSPSAAPLTKILCSGICLATQETRAALGRARLGVVFWISFFPCCWVIIPSTKKSDRQLMSRGWWKSYSVLCSSTFYAHHVASASATKTETAFLHVLKLLCLSLIWY
jgi:hypothetical protein